MSEEMTDATQPSPPPVDLERVLVEIDAASNDDAAVPLGPEHLSSKLGLILRHWPTIRAALTQYQQEGLFSDRDIERLTRFGLAEDQLIELQKQLGAALARERELRGALREIAEMWSAELMRDRAKEALLVQAAAGEKREW